MAANDNEKRLELIGKREALHTLLADFPEVAPVVMQTFDHIVDQAFKTSPIEVTLALNKARIKNRSDLHRHLVDHGIVFNSPQYNSIYDRYVEENNLPIA
jgi:signal transduction histidine kinase